MDKESLINKAATSSSSFSLKKDTLSDVSILRGLLILLAVAFVMSLLAFSLVLFVWSSIGAIEGKCRLQISVYNAMPHNGKNYSVILGS